MTTMKIEYKKDAEPVMVEQFEAYLEEQGWLPYNPDRTHEQVGAPQYEYYIFDRPIGDRKLLKVAVRGYEVANTLTYKELGDYL